MPRAKKTAGTNSNAANLLGTALATNLQPMIQEMVRTEIERMMRSFLGKTADVTVSAEPEAAEESKPKAALPGSKKTNGKPPEVVESVQ